MEPMTNLKQTNNERQKLLNLTIVSVLSQVGLLTVGIILAALVAGIFLDSRFGTKPWFTLGFIIASVPVSLAAMVYVARTLVKKIRPEEPKGESKEENGLGNE
jgi:F0F1-type ATP synthase assembly protein I